mgnify:CR=1 FL=1
MTIPGQHLGFLLVGVDLEADIHVLALRDGLEHPADGRGAEAVAADQQRDVGLAEDELEAQALRPEFGNLELGLGGELDELDGDVLEEIPDLIGYQLHAGMMQRKRGRARMDGIPNHQSSDDHPEFVAAGFPFQGWGRMCSFAA